MFADIVRTFRSASLAGLKGLQSGESRTLHLY